MLTPPGDEPRRTGVHRRLPALLGVQGILLATVVGRDGTPPWRAARVLVVVGITGLAVWQAGRLSSRGRGLLALAFGAAGTVVGLGLGLPYAVKTGLTAPSVVGVASLVTGIALLVVATVLLTKAAHGWWRLMAVPASVLVVALVLYPLAFAVAATNVPPTALDHDTPADRGLAYLDVTYRTSDGITISAWYVPSSNRAAVILLHGSGSTRSAVLDHAVVLARHGYGVLLADARGHGRSGGRAMDFGWYGNQDIGAAVSYLLTRPDVDGNRIAAVGLSMGGEEAVGAAGGDPRIRAVVGEGVTNRTYADKAWLDDTYGLRGWLQQRVEWVLYTATDLLTAADPPLALRDAVARAAPRPVLLIAAGDVADEATAARWIQSGSPTTVAVWVVPGAGHTGGLHVEPQEWEARVTSFLDQALILG